MARNANLYILVNKDWKPLVKIIENSKNDTFKKDITIFQLQTSSSKDRYYAILSLSDNADTIIEEYGANPADEKDYLRTSLLNYSGEALFGEKANLAFLNKIPHNEQ